MSKEYIEHYFKKVAEIAQTLDKDIVDTIASGLHDVRENKGRLFILGVGGSAANCGHAVNDFRKLAQIETYAPTDNVAELTARTNDEGWETVFSAWLEVSRLSDKDALLVYSVGGGNLEKNVSPNLVRALEFAQERQAKIYGLVGRDGGFTAKVADAALIIPDVDSELTTPLAESFQAVVWHCLVCHPKVMRVSNKWEGIRP